MDAQLRLVALLACLAVLRAALADVAGDVPTNITVTLLQHKRCALIPEQQYTFSVPVVDASRKGLAAVVFQIHAQRHQIILSQDPVPEYGRYANGSHIGLYQELSEDAVTLQFYATVACLTQCNGSEKVNVMVAATVVYSTNPTPGGCTLVSPLDVDPNLALSYTQFTTKLIFQPGNAAFNPVIGQIEPDCTASRPGSSTSNVNSIRYQVYRHFLSWRGASEDDMFSAIESMLSADNLTKSGYPNVGVDSSNLKQTIFDSFIGEGVVYNVLAVDTLNSAHSTAYVPSVTYACEFNSGGNLECGPSLASMIVAPIVGLIGLFLVYLAHRLFHVEVIVFTFLIASFSGYILVSTFIDSSFAIRVGAAAGFGVLLVVPLFIWWFFTGWYLMFVFFFTAAGGFLLAATLMYTPFGMLSVWKISYVYGLFIACVVVFLLIPAVLAPRVLNIVSCSFVGGYLVIYGVGAFVYTSLPEIVLRVVKNIYVPGYLQSDSSYPFELNDIILVCIWFFLLVSGIIIQFLLARKRDAFPKSLYKQWQERVNGRQDDLYEPRGNKRNWRRRLHSYASSGERSGERTRLLN